MRRSLLLLLPLLTVLSACIVEAPTSEKSGSSPARTQAKPVAVKNGAILGEGQQIELVGATFAPASVTPGDTTRIVLVFRAVQPLPEDWQIFVHVEDAEGRQERVNADHPPRRPTSSWRAGEIIQDEFAFTLPPGWRVRAVNLFVGLWLPRTEARMKVRNPEAVRTDGNDRVLLVQLPVVP
jgi:hypothetical protein